MNITNTLMRKAGALIVALALVAPTVVVAAGTYSITAGTPTILGMVATVSGTASVDDSGANENTIHVGIDWNEDKGGAVNIASIVELDDSLVQITCPQNEPCTVTWGPISHDYTSAGSGTYTAFAVIYHGKSVGGDGLGSSQIANISIVIPPPPTETNLSINKTVSDATPDEGQSITYTLTATNSGPAAATGVTVTDSLPAGLSYVSSNPSAGTYNSGTGIWTIGAMANGATSTLEIVATVDADTGGDTIINSATIAGGQTDPTPANNTETESVVVNIPPPDLGTLQVVKIIVGQDASPTLFSFTVNGGSVTAFESDGSNDFSVAPGTYTVAEEAAANWSATYSDGTNSDCIDIVVAKDTVSVCTITNTYVPPAPTDAGITVVKTVDDATPAVGGTVVYTITVTNTGPANATGVVVNDLLPTGITYVSSNPSQGSYVSNTGVWSVGSLLDDASATLTITATVDQDSGSEVITNTATASSNQTDPTPGDNTEDAVITVDAPVIPTEDTVGLCTDLTDNDNDELVDFADPDCASFKPTLTLVKYVSGDGELLPASTWTLSADGPTDISGSTGSEAVTNAPVLPGEYVLSESSVADYTSGDWSCVFNAQGDAQNDPSPTLAANDDVVCSITNTYNPDGGPTTTGTLVVNKVVVNDDDGSASADSFSFSVDEVSDVESTPSVYAFEADGQNLLGEMKPATYTITEVEASGYSVTYENCSNVELTADTTEVCTITNNDIASSGGGGGGGGGRNNNDNDGEVLGASTFDDSCSILLPSFLGRGYANNPAEVIRLQAFLNVEMGSGLPNTGVFGPLTTAAVHAFQKKHWEDVLKPWFAFPEYGIVDSEDSTGIVYKTTQWKVNMIDCPSLNLPLPVLP